MAARALSLSLVFAVLAAAALGGVVNPSKEYVGEFTSDKGLTWKTDGAANAEGLPTTKQVRDAIQHVLLETYSTALTLQGEGAIPIERADLAKCGPAEAGPGWAGREADLRKIERKFKRSYVFSKKVGDIFIGTDGVELQAFDGTISVTVRDKKMALSIKSGGSGRGLMTLQVQLHKFGIALPAIPASVALGMIDLSDGVHLHEWFGNNGPWPVGGIVPSDKYAIKIAVAVDAVASLGRNGKWTARESDIRVQSPRGLEFAGDLADSGLISKLKDWGVVDKFANIGGLLQTPLYCTLKYTVPGIPWLGHIATFVAGDQPGDNKMTFSINTQLSDKPRDGSPRTLGLALGTELDVPTMNFIAHLIETAQRITEDLDAKEAASKDPKTAAERHSEAELKAKVLEQLKAMGFDKEVLEAMRIIKLYAAKLTRSTAEASKFITAFFNNVFTLIFSNGNELGAKFKGGLHLGGSSAKGKKGDLTGKVHDLWLKTKAVETPVYPHLFLFDKEQLEEFTQRAVEAGGLHAAAAQDGGYADEAFTMKGKITLAKAENLAITGSAKVRTSDITQLEESSLCVPLLGVWWRA